MFSKILLKLIDQAIVPALLLLATRVVSIVFISKHFGYTFTLGPGGFTFNNFESYQIVNSFSLLFMVGVLTFGITYVLVKSLVFHESHITPHLTAKLFSIKAPSLIQNSFELYSQGAIWLSYCYLLLIVSGIMAFFGLIYSWIFYVIFSIVVGTTVFFIIDIDKELNMAKEENLDSDLDYLDDKKEDKWIDSIK